MQTENVSAQIGDSIARALTLLGGSQTLHRTISSELELHDAIAHGLPKALVRHLTKSCSSLPSNLVLEAVGISDEIDCSSAGQRTRRLTPDQSGRIWKLAQIISEATAVFGSRKRAEAWLTRPAIALDQRRPIDLLSSLVGFEIVEHLLGRIAHGISG